MKMLNLNEIERPTLTVVLRDDKRTKVDAEVPDVDQINRLRAMRAKMSGGDSEEKLSMLYAFVAELLSRNRQGLAFNADSLRDVYHVGIYDIIAIIKGFFELISEIGAQKN